MTSTASLLSPPAPAGPTRRRVKVAYLMSRFPRVSETFVFREILAVEKLGVDVEIYPLRRETTPFMHPEADALVERAHFAPYFSWAVLCANVYFLCRRPAAYLVTLATLLWANLGSYLYFCGAIAFFPKAVYFARRMQQTKVAHVHAHFCSHPAAMAFVIRRLAGIPYSFTAHGSDLHCDRHMLKEKVAEARFVVAISEFNRQVILDECGRQWADKVRVIHCGIDARVFPPRTEPTAYDRGAGPLEILCVGRLLEVKGQTYLIDACRRLRDRGLDVHCHFVGDGPEEPRLQQQVDQAALGEHVTFHGRQPSQRVAELLHRADVMVLPSVLAANGAREGIPVALMEAMSVGVPVVSSRLSGIPELVEDDVTGLLAPPRDAAALAECLVRLAGNRELRQRLAAAGRQKVLDEFDLFANAGHLAKHFTAQGDTAWTDS